MRKRIFISLTSLVAILLAVLLFNYFSVHSRQLQVKPVVLPQVPDVSLDRLGQALRIPTVTGQFEPGTFLGFLRRSFPAVFRQLESRVINQGGLILHWRGTTSTRKPVLLVAHYDVVPAADTGWTHAPFAGESDAGFVWGRGSMDDKLSVMALLESVDLLLRDGYVPQRDLYLAFGHDEETGGEHGAARIAEYFSEQGIRFEYVLDEGMLITDGILPFVKQPVALVGIAEKGYADIELTLSGTGGHASMPGPTSLLADMSRAIVRLQANPMPATLTTATRDMLTSLAAEADHPSRLVLANLWLFEPLILRQFAQGNATHAATHTTFAPTQMFASEKVNVLPNTVTARINVRILPGTTSEQVVAHLRKVIANPAIAIRILQAAEPSAVSSTSARDYEQITRAIREVYTDALVAPGLVIPATDSRHYRTVAIQTYRFLPITVKPADLTRFHGVDERIGKQAFRDAIRFYYQLMKNSSRE